VLSSWDVTRIFREVFCKIIVLVAYIAEIYDFILAVENAK